MTRAQWIQSYLAAGAAVYVGLLLLPSPVGFVLFVFGVAALFVVGICDPLTRDPS